jgi:hypothetical protein
MNCEKNDTHKVPSHHHLWWKILQAFNIMKIQWNFNHSSLSLSRSEPTTLLRDHRETPSLADNRLDDDPLAPEYKIEIV